MFRFIRSVVTLLFLAAALPAHAALKVLATTADWGALVNEIGGEQVNVYVATSALQDVHRVDLCTHCNAELFFSHRRTGKPRGVQGVVARVA